MLELVADAAARWEAGERPGRRDLSPIDFERRVNRERLDTLRRPARGGPRTSRSYGARRGSSGSRSLLVVVPALDYPENRPGHDAGDNSDSEKGCCRLQRLNRKLISHSLNGATIRRLHSEVHQSEGHDQQEGRSNRDHEGVTHERWAWLSHHQVENPDDEQRDAETDDPNHEAHSYWLSTRSDGALTGCSHESGHGEQPEDTCRGSYPLQTPDQISFLSIQGNERI